MDCKTFEKQLERELHEAYVVFEGTICVPQREVNFNYGRPLRKGIHVYICNGSNFAVIKWMGVSVRIR